MKSICIHALGHNFGNPSSSFAPKCLHENNNVLSSPKESDGMQRLDKKSVHKKEREAAEKTLWHFFV